MSKPKGRPHGRPIPAHCSSGKRAFTDRQRAVQAGRKAQQLHGQRFRVYKCAAVHTALGIDPGCGQYHLATVREAERAG